MPRLVFLLGEDTEGPRSLLHDAGFGPRQDTFRARLRKSGVVAVTVTSPGELETALLHALTELDRQRRTPMPAGSHAADGRSWRVSWPVRVGVIPAAAGSFQVRTEADELAAAATGDRTAVTWVLSGLGGVGKT